ncbi:hypothetical protein Tco_0546873 [Tanacetum coccineum]
MPHDSPLPRVHTLGSDEGRMQPNELMELVTKLSDRVAVLENDLKQTKKTYGAAFTKLIKKVKTLEKTIKSSKARKRAQFVVYDDEEEDSFNQGRKITEIDEDPDISLKFILLLKRFILLSQILVLLMFKFSMMVKSVSTVAVWISTNQEGGQQREKDRVKLLVEESEPTQNKTKIQQEQERLGFEEAQRLQEQFNKEERQRIAKTGLDIFMLVEKDYPLTRGLPMLMLVNKLQVDQHSEMADELLRKIFILANRPRH